MNNFERINFPTDDELAKAVAAAWLKEVEAATRSGSPHCVALSGGRIARKFLAAVAKQAGTASRILEAVHFFWADERCVPPDNVESNFRIARELLFQPLKIAERQIHRIHGEEEAPAAVAHAEAEICRIAPLTDRGQPRMDLILLGMGEDGHVASLFPGESEAAMANPTVYRAVTAAKPPPQRITLGYAAIAAARKVWVLASGPGKGAMLSESLDPVAKSPLARVIRSRQQTQIFTDITGTSR